MSPRSEVDERTLEMLKLIVRAGLGMVAGVQIALESHHVHNDTETWVFTLGVPEPPAPWLAVALLDEAVNLTSEQVLALEDAERCVAWALLEL
jgi:hypothetical protein